MINQPVRKNKQWMLRQDNPNQTHSEPEKVAFNAVDVKAR